MAMLTVAVLVPARASAGDPADDVGESLLDAVPASVEVDNNRAELVLISHTATTLQLNTYVIGSNGRILDADVQIGADGDDDDVVGPAGRQTVVVAFTSAPDSSAELVVLARSIDSDAPGEVLRVSLTVAVEPSAAEPAVAKWTIERVGNEPDAAQLPLDGVCADLDLTASDSTDPEPVVGTLQANGEWVDVTATCGTPADVVFLKVGDPPVGHEFVGTVDLLPGDEDAGAVELTLRTSRTIWLAVALLVPGIVLAVLLELWKSGRRRRSELRRRVWDVAGSAHRVDRAFRSAAAVSNLTEPIGAVSVMTALHCQAEALDGRLKKTGFKPSDDRLSELEVEVAAFEAFAAGWAATAPVLAEVGEVLADFSIATSYHAELVKILRTTGTPDWATLSPIATRANEAVALRTDWSAASIENDLRRITDDDVRRELRDNLEQADTVEDVRKTVDAIREEAPSQIDLGIRIEGVDVLARRSAKDTPVDEVENDQRRADQIAGRIAWTDRAVVAIVLSTALTAGLVALYEGKAYGTGWDYVKTITWGLGSGLAAFPLGDLIARAADSTRGRLSGR